MTITSLFRQAILIFAFSSLLLADSVPPPTGAPVDPNTIQDCTYWIVAQSSDTCSSVASDNWITVAQLVSYNPSLSSTSCSFATGHAYCVEENYGVPPPTASTYYPSSTSTAPTSSRTSNGVTTPVPWQIDMTNNCNKFYMVVSGDGCSGIATSNGISLANFISWNPDLKSDCSGLFPGYYVCVGIIGMPTSTTFVTSSSTSTTSGNGITTPTPTQVGMVSNCDLFYDVQSGDRCFQIAQNYGINLNDFYAWNPAVGSSCQQLFPDYYVCVGTVGSNPPSSSTSTHSATSTTSGSGITTPTPTQAGMVSNCDLFYDVKSGDGCYDIAQSYGISLNDFYAWTPAVSNDCSGLWPDYYVCVGIGGFSPPPSSTTSTHSSTTSSGSGVTTPTPTQAGMVNNCDAFYDVQSGDGCWAIANEYSISLDNFYAWNPAVGNDCSGLWPDYYVCVGTT